MKLFASAIPERILGATKVAGSCALLLLSLASLGAAATTPAPIPAPVYIVDDLGMLAGDVSGGAWAVNSAGDVVGWSTGPSGSRAFLFTDADGLVELPALGKGGASLARDINDLGDIVGTASAGQGFPGRAVLWTGGGIVDLGVLQGSGFSDAWAINNGGQIVGSSEIGDYLASEHAFLYSRETGMVDLTPAMRESAARDINDSGEITGYSDAPDGSLHAFLLRDAELIDLGELAGFGFSSGASINDKGLVVGTATSPGNKQARMFQVGASDPMEDLNGKLPIAFALAVNSPGQVVGYSAGAKTTRAILYSRAAGVRDLNSLISPQQGWVLEAATDINDSGVIVGYASKLRSKGLHAVRLRPVNDSLPR